MEALVVVDGRVIRVAGKPRAPSPPTTTFIVVICFVVSSGTSEFETFVSSWQVVVGRPWAMIVLLSPGKFSLTAKSEQLFFNILSTTILIISCTASESLDFPVRF